MPRLETCRCPRCGAEVPLAPQTDHATCAYCGTTAYADRGASAPTGASTGPSSAGLLLVPLVGFVLLVVGGGVVWVASRPAPTPAAKAARTEAASAAKPNPPQEPAAPSPPPEAPVFHVLSQPARFADVDGDRHAEVVALVSHRIASEMAEVYAVFDGRTGALRTTTPPLEEARSALPAIVGSRLVLAMPNGKVFAYDLVSGDAQWNTVLGDRVSALCDSGTTDSLHVETADARKLALDLTTGRQTETREPCARVLAMGDGRDDPRDRHDYSAPPGVESYHCGGVTVMGDENYRIPDPCLARAHVDTDRLDGMVGHRLWRHGRGYLVFGVRAPGAYVPMVGRLERGKFVWKSEVPVSNPLEAQQGGPRHVALAGDRLYVAYETGRDRQSFVTAFGVEDGTRLFTVPVAGSGSVDALVAGDEGVLVQGDGILAILGVADGATRATIGTRD